MEVAEDAAASGDEGAVRWHVITRREHHVVDVRDRRGRPWPRYARVEASLESDLGAPISPHRRFAACRRSSGRWAFRAGSACSSWSSMSPCASVASAMTYASAGSALLSPSRRCGRRCDEQDCLPARVFDSDHDLGYARVGRVRGANVAHAAGSDDDNGPSWSCHMRSFLSRQGFCGRTALVQSSCSNRAVVGRCSSLAGRGHSVTRSMRILERSKESACPPCRPPTFPTSSPSGA